MTRTAVVLILLSVTVALPGCLGDAGGIDQTAGPTGQDPGDGSWETRTRAIDWQGNTGTWACAPAGPNTCAGTGLQDRDSWLPIEPEGQGHRIELTLTWQALSPVTEELAISVAAYTSCGDGCYSSTGAYGEAVGPSPLGLELDDIPLDGQAVGYIVYVDGGRWLHEDPVLLGGDHHQPFHVQGTLTTWAPVP